jgi:osmoprotectant transport system substrate-binding protein
MKRLLALVGVVTALLLVFSRQPDACVGKKLTIGIPKSSDYELLAEMLSVLINERTGTAVTIRIYRDSNEVYQALKKGEVAILIENTSHALAMAGKPREHDITKAYAISKEEFKKQFNLIWLKPFGLFDKHDGNEPLYYGPLITFDVLNNFPALPRVINKLSGALTDEVCAKLMESLKSGVNPRVAARDFLKSKKLI